MNFKEGYFFCFDSFWVFPYGLKFAFSGKRCHPESPGRRRRKPLRFADGQVVIRAFGEVEYDR